MSNEKQNLSNPGGGGFLKLGNRIRLVLRLLSDNRINPLLKLLPIGALAYLFFPDPILGPLDDTILLFIGATAFVEMCPPDVVQEHMDEIENVISAQADDVNEDDIFEADARDVD